MFVFAIFEQQLFLVCAKLFSYSLSVIFLLYNNWMADSEQPDEDEVTIDDYYDDLYCPACDKSFKSDKAWVMLPLSYTLLPVHWEDGARYIWDILSMASPSSHAAFEIWI